MSEENKKQETPDVADVDREVTEDTAGSSADQAEASTSRTGDDIEGTAETFEEKTKNTTKRTSEVANQVLDKLKTGLDQAIAVGNRVIGEVSEAASHYAEQYRHSAEIGRLSSRKDDLIRDLGKQFYSLHEANADSGEKLIKNESIVEIMQQVQQINDEIVQIGETLEAKKKDRR